LLKQKVFIVKSASFNAFLYVVKELGFFCFAKLYLVSLARIMMIKEQVIILLMLLWGHDEKVGLRGFFHMAHFQDFTKRDPIKKTCFLNLYEIEVWYIYSHFIVLLDF